MHGISFSGDRRKGPVFQGYRISRAAPIRTLPPKGCHEATGQYDRSGHAITPRLRPCMIERRGVIAGAHPDMSGPQTPAHLCFHGILVRHHSGPLGVWGAPPTRPKATPQADHAFRLRKNMTGHMIGQ